MDIFIKVGYCKMTQIYRGSKIVHKFNTYFLGEQQTVVILTLGCYT
jgi:hypothetical protein